MSNKMTLALDNRDEMARWIGSRARLPEDPGSDVLLVDTPDGVAVVCLGETVETTKTGFRIVGRTIGGEIWGSRS